MSAESSLVCLNCGKSFQRKSSSKRVSCSHQCARDLNHEHCRKPLVDKTCPTCGTIFSLLPHDAKRRVFCSQRCAYQSMRGNKAHNALPKRRLCCAYCQRVTWIDGGLRTRKYCDAACRIASMRGKVPHNKQSLRRLCCFWCHEEFFVRPSYVKTYKYCSPACRHKGRTARRGRQHPLFKPESHVTQKCMACGVLFMTIRARVRNGEGRFCSRSCHGHYRTSMQAGRVSSLEIRIAQILQQRGEPYFAQMPLGPWTADFYLPRYHVVLECDGDYWHALPDVQKRDRRKNGWLQRHGYRVVRLRERDIRTNAEQALDQALAAFVPLSA